MVHHVCIVRGRRVRSFLEATGRGAVALFPAGKGEEKRGKGRGCLRREGRCSFGIDQWVPGPLCMGGGKKKKKEREEVLLWARAGKLGENRPRRNVYNGHPSERKRSARAIEKALLTKYQEKGGRTRSSQDLE